MPRENAAKSQVVAPAWRAARVVRTSGDRPHNEDYGLEVTEVYLTKLLENDELLLRYVPKAAQGSHWSILRYIVALCVSDTSPDN
jgi:hypothetical protein